MPTPILATKLYIPPPQPSVVLRPRLIGQLNEGLHRRLTLISAPAGFGKTTLLSEWIAGCEREAAWLSLDEGDNDLTRFLTYLVAALQTIAANIGEGVSSVLQSPQAPPTESILTALLNEIVTIEDDFILVLDDYHVIDARSVDDALTFLLEHVPPRMHLIIATREDPNLALARLRARGQLCEVRAADLRFTPSEAAEFLNQVMSLNLSKEDIAALETRTEGWIAGLQLAAISMQGRKDVSSFIESFTGSHHFVLDYLLEEVLGQQSESIQAFDRVRCRAVCSESFNGMQRPSKGWRRRAGRDRAYTSKGEPTLSQDRDIRRDILPIPDRPYAGPVTYDAKDPDTSFQPIEPLRPPEGAPNVLVVLLDDVGFAAASAFGGPCSTPTAERLAANGLKYNRFHTTALCSPTRQALLTGRNHHAVGMGGITEIATSAPGYNSIRPNTAAPLAETLKLNGYSTAQFGKCHEVPVWETSPMGPFDAWPSGSGFEHFYGFIGGETNQYAPAIYQDTVPVEPDRTADEGYHFTEDMTDHAINWISQQKALMSDKPFFVYFAPGATHAPHHVRPEWSDADQPEKLQGLQRLFLMEAGKYNVLPLDDRRFERFNPDIAGRPQLVRGKSQLLFGRMGRLSESSVVTMKNKSHSITAQIDAPETDANGVIIAQGGAFGGFVLYAADGKPAYCYNLFGLQQFKVYGEEPIPAGEHQLRMEFAYDGGGLGKGGTVTLYVDGEQVGEGRVEGSVPMVFSADETTDVGSDSATPVSDDYGPKDSEFTGTVRWVQLDIDAATDDTDHLISAHERLRVAMARQ